MRSKESAGKGRAMTVRGENDSLRVTTSETEFLWSAWDCTVCPRHNWHTKSLEAAQQGARQHTLATGHATEVTAEKLTTYRKKKEQR
jgi:hypothetical protein